MAVKINFKIMTILLINIPGQREKRFMGITFDDGCIVDLEFRIHAVTIIAN